MSRTWAEVKAARAERRLSATYQQRNERGQIIAEHGELHPGDGTLPRDVRAHLRGAKVKPKRCRHKEWPWAPDPTRA